MSRWRGRLWGGMRIAVIGTGKIGGTLGRKWLAAGHDVVYGSRGGSAEGPGCAPVVAVADPKKGERLVLVTDKRDAEAAPLLTHAQAVGASELAVPRRIIRVPEIPVLGSGKTDYVALERIVDAELRRVA